MRPESLRLEPAEPELGVGSTLQLKAVAKYADGSEHEVARLAEKFGRRLEARYGVPVAYVDETLSSATAEASLRETRTRAGKKSDVDALAAAIILQSYLDELPSPAGKVT